MQLAKEYIEKGNFPDGSLHTLDMIIDRDVNPPVEKKRGERPEKKKINKETEADAPIKEEKSEKIEEQITGGI